VINFGEKNINEESKV